MDVYEKPTRRSAWLLGLVALRELLAIAQCFLLNDQRPMTEKVNDD